MLNCSPASNPARRDTAEAMTSASQAQFDRFPICGTIERMASIVSVVVTDDIDGSAGAETVLFGIDGATYEIDLAEKNRAKLTEAMAPYVGAARKVSLRRPRAAAGRQAGARVDRAEIRAWAKEQGLKVSERGRISAEIMQQYEASH